MGTATLAFSFLVDNWARSLGVDEAGICVLGFLEFGFSVTLAGFLLWALGPLNFTFYLSESNSNPASFFDLESFIESLAVCKHRAASSSQQSLGGILNGT